MESSSKLPPCTDDYISPLERSHPNSHSNSQSSSSLLRFPTPVADSRVSNWVESSSSATMSSRNEVRSDEGNLGDSTYEFIDTDEESRDDNATESVASTDLGRPDDIASLADTEQSADDSGDEDHRDISSVPTFPRLDHAVENAFNTPTIGRSSYVLDELDKPLVQSIEFEEPFSLSAEVVSVKHTVADYNEEETAETVKVMKLPNPPKRLVVTIRQTMTKQGLWTREPLRILYVGSHSAKQDIIHKIAGSITASVENGNQAHRLRNSQSQLYNVVPVSAFGSERTPEIELMHSSGYQIKVEDCTAAQSLKFEDVPEKPDVIKLTIDETVSYHSVPEGQGFIVEPHWETPHVTIFYCSDSDSIEARRTRTLARKFMNRHAVPSIVISHRQLFDRAQCMSLDQHSLHMCLESRDPNGRGNLILQRLPIDLASFLNIDARQMNRNLAYITGLHESSEASKASAAMKKTDAAPPEPQDLEKTSYSLSDSVRSIRRNGAELRALVPVGIFILSVFAAVLTGIPSYRYSSVPSISINSKTMSAVCMTSTSSATLSSVHLGTTSTPTLQSVSTSTRTVTVTHAPGPNSLSVLPSMELGSLSKTVSSGSKSKKPVCTAEILGDREILIRIPSATKLSWLTKEAMAVNITRHNTTVDTERAYSSDEGIVLLLSRKEAYGILNISIITTKKPKVNETFQVDFGTNASQAWQSVLDKIYSLLPEDSTSFIPKKVAEYRASIDQKIEETRSNLPTFEQVKKLATDHASFAGNSLTEAAKSASLEATKLSAIVSREIEIRLVEAEHRFSKRLESMKSLREPLDKGLLKAQIQSKLVWLKLLGREAEHREYGKRATEAILGKTTPAKSCRKCAGKKTCWAAKKECRSRGKAGKRQRP